MSRAEQELRDQLEHARHLPYGNAQVTTVEQVIAHADRGGYQELAFDARMLATSAYTFSAEPVKAFVTFSRCLSEFDQDPRPYHANFAEHLLWHFKWIVNAMTKFPEVPLARTEEVLDDMERRYRAAGYGLHPVFAYRHRVAAHIGDWPAAQQWYEQWCAAPANDLSDCRACDPGAKLRYLADRGDQLAAVELAAPVLAGQLSCVEQPQAILTDLLVPYACTGRYDEAVAAHRRAYRLLRADRRELAPIADHVAFCGRTGNQLRGLELVRRHLSWLDAPPSPAAAMEFAAAAALVLRGLPGEASGVAVRWPAAGDRPAREIPAGELAAQLAEQATALAARFDERNQTRWQGERIAALLAAEPLVDYLPLSPTARPAPPTGRPGAARPAGPAAATPVAAAAGVPAQASPGELLELAVQRNLVEDWPGTQAVLRAFDERFSESDLDPAERALRLDWRGMEQWRAGDIPGAVERYREAAAALAAAGDQVRAHATLGRLGSLLCLIGEVDEGRELVTASAAYLAEHGNAMRRASSLLRLSEVLGMVGELDQALAVVAQAEPQAGAAGIPHLAARLALHRAALLAEQTERAPLAPSTGEATPAPAELVAAAEQAWELFRPLGGEGYAQACLQLAGAYGDPAAALPIVQEAVAVATGPLALAARLSLGSVLADLGRPAEAVDEYLEAVALAAEQGDELAGAGARFGLAAAYLRTGRPVEAAEVGEAALATFTDSEELAAERDQCRELLIAGYGMLGEIEPALGLLDELVAAATGIDLASRRGQLHEHAGELLWQAGQYPAAAAKFDAAAGEYRAAGSVVELVRARRRAMLAQHNGAGTDGGLEVLAELDAQAAELPADPAAQWEAAMVGYDGARLLAATGRPDRAAERLVPVAGRFRALDAFNEALLAELLRGEVTLAAGYPADSVPVLRAVTSELPRDDARLPHAAWLLSKALAASGEPEQAEAVRREHGLPADDG